MSMEPQTIAHIHRCFEHDAGTFTVTLNHRLAVWIQGFSGYVLYIYIYIYIPGNNLSGFASHFAIQISYTCYANLSSVAYNSDAAVATGSFPGKVPC